MKNKMSYNALRTGAFFLASFLAAFLIIAIVSDTPITTMQNFIFQPLSSLSYIGNIIEIAIPLIFSGLSMSILFQASLFNLGAEGIFYMSAIAISFIAIYLPATACLHPALIMIIGASTGIGLMLIPGFLKAKYKTNELVVSLMLNHILYGIGMFLLTSYLRDPSVGALVSHKFLKSALLPKIIPGTRIHLGLVIALFTVFFLDFFLYRTKWGYEIRITGKNEKFAAFSGIPTRRVIILTHVIAGAIAGLGGSVETIGMHHRFEWSALPGYGFDGAMISMLANHQPKHVVFSSLFVAYLRVGADLINRSSDVPIEMISILQCIILLLISAENFLSRYKQRLIEKEVTNHDTTPKICL